MNNIKKIKRKFFLNIKKNHKFEKLNIKKRNLNN